MFIIVLIQILCTVLQQTCVTSSLRHPLRHPLCHLRVLGVPDGYLYARTPAGHFCVGEEGPLPQVDHMGTATSLHGLGRVLHALRHSSSRS